MYLKHISHQGYLYNLTQPELPNNLTQDVLLADDVMVNGTRDEEEYNTTTKLDTMTDHYENPNTQSKSFKSY